MGAVYEAVNAQDEWTARLTHDSEMQVFNSKRRGKENVNKGVYEIEYYASECLHI